MTKALVATKLAAEDFTMTITVNRGGVTANQWYETGIEARATSFDGALKIRFAIDSKGGGQTDIQVNIEQKDFQSIIELMMECDFRRTVEAFSKAVIKSNR